MYTHTHLSSKPTMGGTSSVGRVEATITKIKDGVKESLSDVNNTLYLQDYESFHNIYNFIYKNIHSSNRKFKLLHHLYIIKNS